MKSICRSRISSRKGSVLVYVIITIVILALIASLGSYLSTHLRVSGKRMALESAYQLASGGASIVAKEVNIAFKKSPDDIATYLEENGYAKSDTYSTLDEDCFTRTIPDSILGQTITTEVWLPIDDPDSVRIIARATVNGVTEEVTVYVKFGYGFGAAIISTHPGTNDTSPNKSSAQAGNVSITVSASGRTIVNGGILANGTVNYTGSFDPGTNEISESLYTTEDEIPNYTNPGSPDQLFDFDRFIAVSDVMGTHYANTDDFKAAIAADADGVLEGVVVVDIEDGASDWSASEFPSGINILGTLVLNFDSSWGETDKLKILGTLNVNPADLTGLDISDATTFTSGYPPVFSDPGYAAANVDISGSGFTNFKASDDLPAIMYRTAIADFHGNVNVSGAVYSPVFAEIENKVNGQVQYFSGSIIGGGGIYWENQKNALSIISYDPAAVDQLATAGSNAKTFEVARRD